MYLILNYSYQKSEFTENSANDAATAAIIGPWVLLALGQRVTVAQRLRCLLDVLHEPKRC